MPIQQRNARLFMFGEQAARVGRLILLGLAINTAGCSSGNAQATAPPKRLGILMGGSSCPGTDGPTFWRPMLQKLAGRGWIEGRTLVIDCISAGGLIEQAPMLARELVTRRPDVLLGAATLTVRALKQATTEIPIVTAASDPLRSGIVNNLAHPDANVTGLAPMTFDLTAKRMDVLKELLPRLSRLAVVIVVRTAPDPVDDEQMRKDVAKTAEALGVDWKAFYSTSDSLEQIFAQIAADRFDAAYVWTTAFAFASREQIAKAALQHGVPTISDLADYARQGLLLTYGQDIGGLLGDAAEYIDKLLQGTKPADLPLQQPTKFDLVINLKTAKGLGVTFPPSLLVRADEVIE
ncbi:ABC transporter substrate-binding protein [Bradyrhizobium guangdongense]|uniref:ABC transporter substrate-binding protein n=1 Tax=Bradyrhizobium guangdongense TaxID=1325090 RepID=UPI00164328BC|nr:ABC transporter substrate-binding protein [Bradyrhizobium guangdongense]